MFAIRLIIATLLTASFAAKAQQEVDINSLPVDLQAEVVEESADNRGQLRRNNNRRDPNVIQVQEDTVAAPSQGVLILNSNTNQNRNRADAVLQQPPTYVEASPLTDSRAEQLRRVRQAAEVNTEQKIVEKLESSRLEDERDRAERLFSNRWENPKPVQQAVPVQAAPVQPVPVYGQYEQPSQTVEVVNVDENNQDLTSVKEEIIEAVKEVQAERLALDDLKAEKQEEKDQYYIGAVLGMANYDADNVESNGAGGFSVGTITQDGVIIEGSFLYSNYYLDQWWAYDSFKEIDQYNFGFSAKYTPMKGRIKPFAGAHMSYTYRKYTDRTFDYYNSSNSRRSSYRRNNNYSNEEEVTSNAVDMGFLVGLDFFVSETFSIGAEYKYSMNLFSKSDSDFMNRHELRAPENSEPLENIDYSTFGITGKVAF